MISQASLDRFPTEVFQEILRHLASADVKSVSCLNKRLREISEPIIFRHVRFHFCEAGFKALNHFLHSKVLQHVVSFTYVFPELFPWSKFRNYVLWNALTRVRNNGV